MCNDFGGDVPQVAEKKKRRNKERKNCYSSLTTICCENDYTVQISDQDLAEFNKMHIF